MRFEREYEQKSYGTIIVEADTPEEAQEKYENEEYEDNTDNMEDKLFTTEWKTAP